MSTMDTNKCRKTIFQTLLLNISTLAEHIGSLSFHGQTLLVCLPAFIIGCKGPMEDASEEISTTIRVMKGANEVLTDPYVIDIFVFNDNQMQRLDSYQRSKITTCSTINAASSAGNKIITALANSRTEKYDWAWLNSRESLGNIRSDLEKEKRDSPVMSGECHSVAGKSANLYLQRLRSEVIVKSISCDFRDKPYSSSVISNAKAYLTNVNAEASVFDEPPALPFRIINAGRLDENDIEGFEESDFIIHEFEQDIEFTRTYPGICFLCYPNEAETETPGSPFTRLVIEGTIDGHLYYWPIDINRDEDGMGISRNSQYIYDIIITRTGTSDPDTPIKTEDAEIKLEVKEWSEREEYGVRF